MSHQEFEPVNAAREDRRQANEALGRSFCKTVAEPITNSDSSAKRKHNLPHGSGLVEMMLATPKGTLLDTSGLKARLAETFPKRLITLEVVTNKAHGRPAGEIVITDQAQGMSSAALCSALDGRVHVQDSNTMAGKPGSWIGPRNSFALRFTPCVTTTPNCGKKKL